MKQSPVIFIFNSALLSGCDYVLQTIRIVSRDFPVFGIALGDIVSLPRLLMEKDKWIVRSVNGAIIFRPVSILPFVRFRGVRMLAYIGCTIFLRVYVGIRYLGKKKILWFFEPFYISKLLFLFDGYITIYDCVDYYPGFSIEANIEHNVLMTRAQYIFANSSPLANELCKRRSDVVQVPLGFADNLFVGDHIHSISPHKKLLTVGFIGSISDRIDFRLYTQIVKKLPNVQFDLVGPLEPDVFQNGGRVSVDLTRILKHKNVRWYGAVQKDALPSLLSQFDVCLIPYRVDDAFNRFSFPMKTMEYFAAGKVVISTDILALQSFARDDLLYIISSLQEFVDVLQDVQKRGWSSKKQKKQFEIAMAMSWQKKVTSILSGITPS